MTDLTLLRTALHDYIDKADERVLHLLYGMMKADQEIAGEEDDFFLTDTYKQILEERSGKSDSPEPE
jgi:hypothetical protein